jgi:hypothetical protein
MFGQKAKDFLDWQEKNSSVDEGIMVKANEIKVKLNGYRENAKENIEKAKVKRMRNQNNSQKVTHNNLATGSKGYITIEGIQNKLSPKYCGPFTVVKQTILGNYMVKNILGNTLSESFPLSRLKLDKSVFEEVKEDKFYEFERILDHRKVKNGYEFSVKWKNYGEKSWEPSKNFVDRKVVENYCKTIKKPQTKQGGKPKLNIMSVLNLLISLLHLCLLSGMNCTTIQNKFYVCNTPNVNDLNNIFVPIATICSSYESKKEHILIKDHNKQEAKILIKTPYALYGEAIQCQMLKIKLTT